MPRRTEDFRGLAQSSRLRLLAAVQDRPGLLLRELVEVTGLHENTVRDHLVVLENEGLIAHRAERRGTRGRPPLTYHPVSDPDENPAARERIDGAAERGDLLRRIAPSPGAAVLGEDGLHQIDALYEHLDDAGLEPEIDELRLRVDMVPCRHYSELEGDRELLCAVHTRLIRDVLHQVPGPVEIDRLEPFVTPHACRLSLRTTGDSQPSDSQPST